MPILGNIEGLAAQLRPGLGIWHRALVSRDGLTRREIGWLLAQEARGAAQALRRGIEIKVKESMPPPSEESALALPGPYTMPMLDGLSALDDAIGMLGDLQSHSATRRRGRIDLAALLYELAPQATITLSAEGGTEVFGDQEELCRMLQMLLTDAGYGTPTSGAAPEISVQRKGDEVHVLTELGPDAAPQAGLERRWLNRMAMRLGGRLAVSGRAQTLVLPADGVVKEAEIKALRQELAEAQELGEAYARELASVLSSAEMHALPQETEATERWTDIVRLAPALAYSLEHSRLEDSPLLRAVTAIGEFRASELSKQFPIADVWCHLGQEYGANIHVNPVDGRFFGAPGATLLLARLLITSALEQPLVPREIIATAQLREQELELAVTFLASDGGDAQAPTQPLGFAWSSLRALARQSGGRAGFSIETSETAPRLLFWARVPEQTHQNS